MREIKFRVWDKEKQIMLHGFPFDITFELQNEPYVAMQYTGLKDKNGKEIYEGDIITKIHYVEEYNMTDFGTDLGKRKETLIVKMPDFYYWLANAAGDVGEDYIGEYVSEMVVSGNIYENPNLLSQDK